ncbi:MAG: hypothetical protein VKI63_07570 [Cyanobium sp.]|nr:hypothetical protein [Cyanobium sp.]
MPSCVTTGDSLIASLCREVDGLRQRSGQLHDCMQRCQDSRLFTRLRLELDQLQRRRRTLQECARSWRREQLRDPLALEFLLELCSRPLP